MHCMKRNLANMCILSLCVRWLLYFQLYITFFNLFYDANRNKDELTLCVKICDVVQLCAFIVLKNHFILFWDSFNIHYVASKNIVLKMLRANKIIIRDLLIRR